MYRSAIGGGGGGGGEKEKQKEKEKLVDVAAVYLGVAGLWHGINLRSDRHSREIKASPNSEIHTHTHSFGKGKLQRGTGSKSVFRDCPTSSKLKWKSEFKFMVFPSLFDTFFALFDNNFTCLPSEREYRYRYRSSHLRTPCPLFFFAKYKTAIFFSASRDNQKFPWPNLVSFCHLICAFIA